MDELSTRRDARRDPVRQVMLTTIDALERMAKATESDSDLDDQGQAIIRGLAGTVSDPPEVMMKAILTAALGVIVSAQGAVNDPFEMTRTVVRGDKPIEIPQPPDITEAIRIIMEGVNKT